MRPDKILAACLATAAACLTLIGLIAACGAQQPAADARSGYAKSEHQIPMRDGKRLYTVVYAPRDTSQKYPILMTRTPYGSGPYGEGYRPGLGPSPLVAQEGYIFVYQDVRGTFMSEGEFEDVRPHLPQKKGRNETDESSDTYDSIEWLLKNVANHNGRVGVWGISYPGFYATMSLLDAHPALKAVSPQAPIADWFLGDDDHHNGAFFLFDAFGFNMFFGMPRPGPTPNQFKSFTFDPPDAYRFFLNLGPVANAQKQYFKGQNKYWNDLVAHPIYDEFWRARTPLPHLRKVTPAVLVVGGWFDAENLYGALRTYETVEKHNPGAANALVMGPWSHGGWARGTGEGLGEARFGAKTSEWYQEQVELPFFNFHLKGKGEARLPEATVFRTGANEWKSFPQWPPPGLRPESLYFQPGGKLSFAPPREAGESFGEYVSDPGDPVPYTARVTTERGTGYMIEDQRFAARRGDVLSYQSDPLTADLTLAGPVAADLFVSTSGTDADFVVKLIDVDPEGMQMLIRAEVMRGKFRRSFSRPEPFVANRPDRVKFDLQDVHHSFRAGHRIMAQVQSSWFPLVDRNPQKFGDIYHAGAADFQKATHRLHHSAKLSSRLQVGVLK